MKIFPNAKVVMTNRDPEKWYESIRSTLYKIHINLDGTVGLFLKLIGKGRLLEAVKKTSNQGKPTNIRGMS